MMNEEQSRAIGEENHIDMLKEELYSVNRMLWALLAGKNDPVEVSLRCLQNYNDKCYIMYEKDIRNRRWLLSAGIKEDKK